MSQRLDVRDGRRPANWRLYQFVTGGLTCPVVLGVIVLTTVVYILQLELGPHGAVGLDDPVFRTLTSWAPWIVHGEIWRPVTYMLLHLSGWHLWGNMWPLYLFGPLVVLRYGSAWFLAAYLLCGTGGLLAAAGITHSPGLGLGASIAVYGIHGVVVAVGAFHLSERRMQVYFAAALLSVAAELWPYTAVNFHTNTYHLCGIAVGLVLGAGLEEVDRRGWRRRSRWVVFVGVLAVAGGMAAAGWPTSPANP